jgi:hypothetical protein
MTGEEKEGGWDGERNSVRRREGKREKRERESRVAFV